MPIRTCVDCVVVVVVVCRPYLTGLQNADLYRSETSPTRNLAALDDGHLLCARHNPAVGRERQQDGASARDVRDDVSEAAIEIDKVECPTSSWLVMRIPKPQMHTPPLRSPPVARREGCRPHLHHPHVHQSTNLPTSSRVLTITHSPPTHHAQTPARPALLRPRSRPTRQRDMATRNAQERLLPSQGGYPRQQR